MLRKTILSQSLVLAFTGASLSFAIVPAAYAQSTTVGSVFGQISGQAGSQVIVESPSTGMKRTVAVDSTGKFNASGLPPGKYTASLMKDGKVVSSVDLDVLAGRGAEAVFESSSTQQLETVKVIGRAPTIDVSRAENLSTFTAAQLSALPIATKNLNGIIALAANTTKADERYSGGISIGGGAPSENSYYINGMPVTNALTQLGSIELPVSAIQQAQVQTGGFGAEFGRSVGGVVNVITKSGTNEWLGGVGLSVEPNSLRSKPKNIFYANTGSFPGTDGTIYRYREGNSRSETSTSAYIGGPLIKDKLFMFVAAEQIDNTTKVVNADPGSSALPTTGWDETRSKNTRYLGKVDWYINSDHRIEATMLGDNYKSTDDYYGYDYATHSPTAYSFSQYSKNLPNYTPGVGGEAQILKYQGQLTDDLQISALVGQSSSKHKQTFSFQATAPEILIPTAADRNPSLTYPVAANPLPGGTTAIPNGAQEKTKSFRFDVEYQLGKHLLRAGLDENRLKSINAGDSYANTGGAYYRFYHTTNGNYSGPGAATNKQSLIAAGAVPVKVDGVDTYYYARKRIFDDATNAQSNQSAQYIEDRWQTTRDFLLTLGLRSESFENKNGDGETFLKMKSFYSPRLSAAWDVKGDSSLKLFGSAGRYSLQIPTHVAVRGASRSLYTDQYYSYSSVDPVTGAPLGGKALNDPYSGNNEYGQRKDPNSVAAQNMKPTYQDEITLGFEKALLPGYTGGVKLTYRTLKATIDDFCDPRPIDAYAAANKIDESNYAGFGCATINAGASNTLLIDYAGTGKYTTVNLSAADIGLPKARRTYTSLDFFVEHAFRDGWYGKLTYTYSKSKGNTEGQTKSDNAQTDVATTSSWDFPELMEGAYGYLPNDRTHQIKAYGYYQFTSELGFGSTLVAESGRPRNCFGDYAGTGEDIGGGAYGAVFFYCDGKLTPRGSQGRLPWSKSLDLNVVYKPSQVKGLSVRADVYNLFNSQVPRVVNEEHDSIGTYGGLNPGYGRTIAYSDPRKIRLTVQYDF